MTPTIEVFQPSESDESGATLKIMRSRDYDMAPVVDVDSNAVGYVLRRDLAKSKSNGRIKDFTRQFSISDIVSSSTPVLSHLRLWDQHRFFIVNQANKPVGLVTPADLNKAPVRLVLYVLIAEIEAKLRRLIEREFPNESWTDYLDDAVLKRVDGLRSRDKKDNVELDRVYYLEFSELLQILGDSRISDTMGFTRDRFQQVRKSLNKLRVDVMHTKPLFAAGKQPYSVFRGQLELALNFAGRIPVTSLKRTV
jgi:hypothetical protein